MINASSRQLNMEQPLHPRNTNSSTLQEAEGLTTYRLQSTSKDSKETQSQTYGSLGSRQIVNSNRAYILGQQQLKAHFRYNLSKGYASPPRVLHSRRLNTSILQQLDQFSPLEPKCGPPQKAYRDIGKALLYHLREFKTRPLDISQVYIRASQSQSSSRRLKYH